MAAVQVDSIAGLLRYGLQRGPPPHAAQRVALDRVGHGVEVGEDGLTVAHTFSGNGADGGRIVGDIQTCLPLETYNGVGYFEVHIVHMAAAGLAVVGLAHSAARQQAGERGGRGMCAYRSDGGQYQNAEDGRKAYGAAFSAGDTVGCGYNRRTREVFFTLNGRYLGVAESMLGADVGFDQFHPTVLLDRATVAFTFDPAAVRWSPQAMIDAEEGRFLDVLNAEPIPKQHNAIAMVASYLLQYGYTSTFEALVKRVPELESAPLLRRRRWAEACDDEEDDMDVEDVEEGGESDEAVRSRAALRGEVNAFVMKGEIEAARRRVGEALPGVRRSVWPHLTSQLIVEHIKAGAPLLAIAAAADPLCSDEGTGILHPAVSEGMGLLAYADPAASPLRHLLQNDHRRVVADAVNAAILTHCGYAAESVLEAVVRHAATMPLVARESLAPFMSTSR
eukprot:TRINITY_DN14820_c0_g1_i1.p1 TRINITY_DN14820_c0_g1~~TRINITY_DN14820_c0_g1_i1.p1  ORF type:complete len:449 (+),score=139.52 TRINITY_DN14820_c0_g1_i1:97-1443(+)